MKRIVKTMLGLLFLLTGLAIYLYPNYREWQTAKEVEKIMDSMERTYRYEDIAQGSMSEIGEKRQTEKNVESEKESEAERKQASMEFWEALKNYNQKLFEEGQNIEDVWSFRQTSLDMNALNEGSSTIGYIQIPDIDLTLPLLIGATESNMSSGAVVLAETSMPVGGENTNCVIAAHRGWSGSAYFRDIDQLITGSEVIIQNPWETLTYQVTGTEVIHATEGDILKIQPGKDLLTLFSCYPYMDIGTKYRLVINCERVADSEAETVNDEKKKVRDLAEESMAQKGIIIEDGFTQEVSSQEDILRTILPAIILLVLLLRAANRISDRRQ